VTVHELDIVYAESERILLDLRMGCCYADALCLTHMQLEMFVPLETGILNAKTKDMVFGRVVSKWSCTTLTSAPVHVYTRRQQSKYPSTTHAGKSSCSPAVSLT
jgi:hypothetical protein